MKFIDFFAGEVWKPIDGFDNAYKIMKVLNIGVIDFREADDEDE